MTTDFYKDNMRIYGIIPILKILQDFEQEENFEECAEILKAIEHYNNMFNKSFPTQYNKTALAWLDVEIRKTTDFSEKVREAYIENIDVFVKLIKEKIEK